MEERGFLQFSERIFLPRDVEGEPTNDLPNLKVPYLSMIRYESCFKLGWFHQALKGDIFLQHFWAKMYTYIYIYIYIPACYLLY